MTLNPNASIVFYIRSSEQVSVDLVYARASQDTGVYDQSLMEKLVEDSVGF